MPANIEPSTGSAPLSPTLSPAATRLLEQRMREAAAAQPAERKPQRKHAARTRRVADTRRKGFGTVRKLPSGRFQARYTDPDGTRRTAPRTFESRTAAEDWITTRRADHITGAWRSPELGAIPVGEYLADYLAGRVDLAPRTREQYDDIARLLINADLRHPGGRTINISRALLRDLTPLTVRDWHAAALHSTQERIAGRRAAGTQRRTLGAGQHPARRWAIEQGLPIKGTGKLPADVLAAWQALGEPTPATTPVETLPDRSAGRTAVTRAYTLLRSTLNTAHRDGLIPGNPCTIKGAGTSKAAERSIATPDEVVRLAAHMPEHLRAAVIVGAWSSLRAGELFALTRSHVDLARGSVRVDRALIELKGKPPAFGPPKTAASNRVVYLPGPVVELLAQHMAAHTRPGPQALVFHDGNGKPLTQSRRQQLWVRARRAEGLDRLRWHDLRHTGATEAARAGASLRELQARLGHGTVEAAMVYQHATEDRDRAVAERMAAAIAGPLTTGATSLRALTDQAAAHRRTWDSTEALA